MKNQTSTQDRVSRNSASLKIITDAIARERSRAATEELYELIETSRECNARQGSLSSNKSFSVLR
jgi:hypothetical protein